MLSFWNQNICMNISFKLCIEYCWYHTVSHTCSIPNEFLKKFLPVNCSAVFQWKYIWKYIFSLQPWQVSKIPSCFSRLVPTMEYLMNCIVRLSGTFRWLINTPWGREITLKVSLSYTHTRASCVHSDWKSEDYPTLLFKEEIKF